MSTRLAISIAVPRAYRPQAEYALRALCSGRDVDPDFVSRSEVLARGGILYEEPVEPLPEPGVPMVRIAFAPSAAAYFEHGKELPEPRYIAKNPEDASLPVLFGRPDDGYKADISADIVASAFFWLSDWQQCVIRERDEHGRVPFAQTLQAQQGWAERPLVDEYADHLFEALRREGLEPSRKKWGTSDFAFAMTFDFDNIRSSAWGRLWRAVRTARPGKLRRAVKRLFSGEDPVRQSIERMLEFTGELGIAPTVFLKAADGRDKHDARDYLFHPYFPVLLNRLRDLRAQFGIHPGYPAGMDPLLAAAEKLRLEQAVYAGPITAHRSHYLRYEGLTAPRVWEEEGYESDSTMAWAEHPGFRTGTCRPHPVFDIEGNRPAKVIEWPLCAMDAQLEGYMGLKQEAAFRRLTKLTDTVERHGGVMVWNFHQTVYSGEDGRNTASYFEEAVREVMRRQPLAETFSQLSQRI